MSFETSYIVPEQVVKDLLSSSSPLSPPPKCKRKSKLTTTPPPPPLAAGVSPYAQAVHFSAGKSDKAAPAPCQSRLTEYYKSVDINRLTNTLPVNIRHEA